MPAESKSQEILESVKHNYWISSQAQTRLSHKWRTEEAAILIGSQTYLDDRPQLTARLWSGENPVPIVLDRRQRLSDVPSHWMHLRSETVRQAVAEIHRAGLLSLIVEGGRQILDAFLSAGLCDEIRIFLSPQTYGSGLKAPSPPADIYIPVYRF
jgi:diaminohydroxyphosphoribosylaminopyrimidine deaminase/5-amino-6-(5-phosphoribosylamino)uracil reductase